MFEARKIMIVNAVLFLIIVGTAVFILTRERRLPGKPPVAEAREEVTRLVASATGDGNAASREFQSLGKVNIFETIIPIPPPTPTPVPPPPEPPNINEVTEYWKLLYVMSNIASFQHIKTNQEITLKIGESHAEAYRGKQITVYLESVDKRAFSATVMINELNKEQRRTFKMF